MITYYQLMADVRFGYHPDDYSLCAVAFSEASREVIDKTCSYHILWEMPWDYPNNYTPPKDEPIFQRTEEGWRWALEVCGEIGVPPQQVAAVFSDAGYYAVLEDGNVYSAYGIKKWYENMKNFAQNIKNFVDNSNNAA